MSRLAPGKPGSKTHSEHSGFIPEIQGLRCIAVVAVVLFHLAPKVLSGGYVGVDVFFVVSGFLITRLLVKDVEEHGTVRLLNFYERRVRRLLPAACLVLLCVAASTPLLPASQWQDIAWEVLASAFYAQNWQLAAQAVDYLNADKDPTPVQHYWSLSIEEQFYIVWPGLIVLAVLLAKRTPFELRRSLRALLVGVVLASVACSVVQSFDDQASAYFMTQTRVWELGIGALLAMTPRPWIGSVSAEALRIAGLTMIVASCVMFSGATVFPGYAALLPTLGTALAIFPGSSAQRTGAAWLLRSRPFQYIGDISYSVYLWHWPLIILYENVISEKISLLGACPLLGATLLLSHLTKRYVEDTFRAQSRSPGGRRIAFGAGAGAILSCALAAGAILFFINRPTAEIASVLVQPNEVSAQPFLTAKRLARLAPLRDDGIVPSPSVARNDVPVIYHNKCHVKLRSDKLSPCEFGNPKGHPHVVLVGDSHAANWMPSLERIAITKGWRLTTQTKSSCPFLDATANPVGKRRESCQTWRKKLRQALLSAPPDVIIFSEYASTKLDNPDRAKVVAHTLARTYKPFVEMGITVVGIADTPRIPFDPPKCVSMGKRCEAPASQTIVALDSIPMAKEYLEGLKVIGMNDTVCSKSVCPSVVGDLLVWRDHHHLTATYSRALAPLLAYRLQEVLGL